MKLELEIPSLLLINAPQGSGKSHLIRYLMYQNRKKFAYGIVFTNTYFEDDSFDYISPKYKHSEYKPEILTALMKIQENLIKEGVIKEAFVIFDDCIDQKQFSCPKLKQLCTQLRHYHITVIFATQYAKILPPYIRTNMMGCVIFKTENEGNLKALYQNYAQLFENFNEFKNFVMQNLGNYKFIYKTIKNNSENVEEAFPIMLAPKTIPKFKISFDKQK